MRCRTAHPSPSPLLSLLLPVVLVVAALASCDHSERRKESTPHPTEKPPAAVDGIPTARGTHKQNLDVGTFGHREYLLHVPDQLTRGAWRGGKPERPLPLLIALHGGLATMGQMRTLTGYDDLSDRQGFLVAYPDGVLTTWNAGDCCGAAKVGKVDDVGFLTKLIDKLTGTGLADSRRVYVAGFSNGAGMAYRMACERAGKVAGIGVVEGALLTPCDPERPVSAMIVHGTADQGVPYDGGGHRDFNDSRPYPPVSEAVEFWRKADDLGELTKPQRGPNRAADCSRTGRGRDGAEVAFCKINGGTHSWPKGMSAALWDYFAAHPRR